MKKIAIFIAAIFLFYGTAIADEPVVKEEIAQETMQLPNTVPGFFKVGDRVSHVLLVDFSGVPAYFRPFSTVIGTISKIDDNGFCTVSWDNGKTTTSNPANLGKYESNVSAVPIVSNEDSTIGN